MRRVYQYAGEEPPTFFLPRWPAIFEPFDAQLFYFWMRCLAICEVDTNPTLHGGPDTGERVFEHGDDGERLLSQDDKRRALTCPIHLEWARVFWATLPKVFRPKSARPKRVSSKPKATDPLVPIPREIRRPASAPLFPLTQPGSDSDAPARRLKVGQFAYNVYVYDCIHVCQ